jgi:hypothetical protein
VHLVKKMNLIGVLAAPVLMFAIAAPSFADSTCKDGTTSTATGKGTCSGHGGVQKAAAASAGTTGAMSGAATSTAPAKTTPPAATAAAPAAPAAGAAPAGATAKCKDGTYSTSKSHSGACSKHGGVSDFLTPAK